MSRIILLQEAFDRLLVAYKAGVACERFSVALRENRVRLYCDGNLLTLRNISTLKIVIESDPDSRWRCEAVPQRTAWERTDYRWEVDEEGIEALMPPMMP